ncbi:hypothetical protein D3C87_1672660 [compost metagenome]
MFLLLVTAYAAYRGIWWIVDWQNCKFSASAFEWFCNCIMTCVSAIALVVIVFTTDIHMSTGESGFGISFDFSYELKPKE